MPKAYLQCVRNGGKIRTKKLSGNRYMHICKTKSGKWVKGEIKKKKGVQ